MMHIKNTLLVLACCCGMAAGAHAQDNPEAEIKKTILTFFEGFSKSDTNLVAAVSDPNLQLQTVIESQKGTTRIRTESRQHLMESVAKIRGTVFEERIVSWDIRTDGHYANAWCSYIVYIDSVMHHYGTDNFQLIAEHGKWRILAVTDTRRKNEPNGAHTIRPLAPFQPVDFLPLSDSAAKSQVNLLLDNWHKAAATADEKVFFGSMDSLGVYLGTDKTENWTRAEFEAWSKKFFDRDKAWDFKPRDRHVYLSSGHDYAWFDELLDTWMGICRGSGVLHCENGQWKIMHYNLAVTLDNAKTDQFIRMNK